MSLVKNFQNSVFHHNIFSRGDKIIIGVSGGPDSICLLRILEFLKRKHKLELKIVHINYALRGQASIKDERFVLSLAKKLDLPCRVYAYQPSDKKENLEEHMRDFRYRIFEKERVELGFDWIAVAHTKDDQAETFFMNLIRGAGLVGLGAMPYKRGFVIRPLLDFRKNEILDYLEKIGQTFRLDQTNRDVTLFRNRIRLKLLPFIEKEFNPKIVERLGDLTQHLQKNNLEVEEIDQKLYNKGVKKKTKEYITLKIDVLVNECSDNQIKSIFRQAIKDLQGNTKSLSSQNSFEFLKIVKSSKSKIQKMCLRDGLIVERKGACIIFSLSKIIKK